MTNSLAYIQCIQSISCKLGSQQDNLGIDLSRGSIFQGKIRNWQGQPSRLSKNPLRNSCSLRRRDRFVPKHNRQEEGRQAEAVSFPSSHYYQLDENRFNPIPLLNLSSNMAQPIANSHHLCDIKLGAMMESVLFSGLAAVHPKDSNRLSLQLSGSVHKGSLILGEHRKAPSQLFTIVKVDHGQVSFRLKSSGLALTVLGESEEDGGRLVQEEYSGKRSQKFRVVEMSPHSGDQIIYTFCGKVLDVCECKIKKENLVFQYTFNGGDNQLWRVTDKL